MVSRKNINYKAQQDAKCVPHYGIRKLSIGVASVLLGTVFYMQNVHADVNPTVSAGNDSVNVVNKDSGTSGSAGAVSTSTGVGSVGSAGSIASAGDVTNSTVPNQALESPAEGVTKQESNTAWVASEPKSAMSAGQVNVGTDNSNSISSLPPASHHQAAGGNPNNERLSDNLSLSVNQKLNVNNSFLLASKVALTSSDNAANGGFDSSWGKLDVNAWKGSVQGNYYQLTDYTGDANHVIVPNEADFAKAGISTSGKQVGVTSDLMHRIFKHNSANTNVTIAFSKTDNKMVKAIDSNWSNTWNPYENFWMSATLGKFDGTNLDVFNVTNMTQMFAYNGISDLSSLANWNVSNATDMSEMFEQNHISDLSPLANWKVNNVTNMANMFEQNQISDLSPLASWNVSNVINMSEMFEQNHISDLSPLANWNVNNVTNMSEMFEQNQISDLSPLASWNVSNVTNMSEMFEQNQISDLSPLSNWKVDNVNYMSIMFAQNQISNLSSLANWKVNNVINMSKMFEQNQIKDLSPLANWKVDNVKDMSSLFEENQISDLRSLANWHTNNVIVMNNMFHKNQISDLRPLANWNVNNVTNMRCMFQYNQISDLSPLSNWKVDNVTDMDEMFEQNQIIDLIPLANWKVDNVLGMGFMFENNQISDLSPLVNWKVNNVVEMIGMFDNNRISDLSPLANWKVDHVEMMGSMFGNNQISDLSPLSNWKVDNVIDMSQMFYGNHISDISPLANWNVNNVGYMDRMFDNNSLIITQAKRVINFAYPAGYTGKKQDPVTQTVDLPQKVSVTLTTKDLNSSNNILDWVTKTETPETPVPVYFSNYIVPEIKGLLEPDKTVIAGQQADITKPINVTVTYKLVESNTNDAFALDSKNDLHEHANVNDNGGYDEDYWGKLNVDDWNYTVNGDTITINGLKDGISTGANDAVIVPNLDDFKLAGKDGSAKAVYISKDTLSKTARHKYYGLSKTNGNTFATDSDLNNAFSFASNLTHADLNSLNMGNVTDMSSMFGGASSLTSLNVSKWDTSKVIYMGYMFYFDSSLKNLDVSKWDTSKVINMNWMFDGASSLTNLDVSKWNTSKVIYMNWMFDGASSLTNLDVSKWDTSKVTNMSLMFSGASSLTSLDVSKWDTSNVTDMNTMFYDASNLTDLDLSKWNTSKVINMTGMFGATNALRHLNISNWDLTKLSNKDSMQNMFAEDPNLTVIANDLKLPTWYQNEINDADYFWNNHMAVITNVPELIKSTGDVNNLKIDKQNASRSIFYDSKGSSDAIQVLKDANQVYINQYQNEHPGYILNLAADVDQTDPIALANANFVSVPREVQFMIAYYDLTGKMVNSTTSTHKVGDTVSISPVAPVNYVLANGQLGMDYLMRWGLNEADFLVEPKVTMATQTKTVSRIIKVQMTDGQTKNVVQTVTFVRNAYLNQVTKQTRYSLWSFGGQYQFSGYQPKPMAGYTADVVPTVTVTPDSLNTMVNVVYHRVPVVYSVDYQLVNGTVVKNVSATPERDGMIHLTAPQGYRLLTTVTDVQVGHSSQKLTVLVLPDEQTYTAYSALPSVVTEPLTKTVTRTINVTMPNGRVRRVVQQVHFVRTVTVVANGKITYSNWTGVGQTSFDRLFVPKRRGYRLVMMDNQDQTLIGVNQMVVDPTMNNVVINLKYVK